MGRGSSAYAGPRDTSSSAGVSGGARGAGGGQGPVGAGSVSGGPRAPATPGFTPPQPTTSPATASATTRQDPAEWSTWWRFNGDAYLDLKSILAGLDSTTPGDGADGKGRAGLSQDVINDRVAPALWSVIQRSGDMAMMRSAVLALGRVQSSWKLPQGQDLDFAAPQLLGADYAATAEAAIIALGVAQDPSEIPTLIDILRDTADGRAACKKESVDYRRRAFAAYSLAMIGHGGATPAQKADIVRALMENLRYGTTAPYDVQLACIIGLGLVPLDSCAPGTQPANDPLHVCRGEQLNFLLAYLDDEQRLSQLRAQTVIPLARLAAGATNADFEAIRAALLEPLATRSHAPVEVQQSCVIALGLLGDDDSDALDRDIRAALYRSAASGDRLSRMLALISIAKTAARAGSGENDGKALASAQEFLLAKLVHGDTSQRAWSAIALGVLGVERARAGATTPPDVALALRNALGGVRSKDEAGAYCLGLGLLRDHDAATPLGDRIAKGREPGTRVCAALSLGLVGAREAVDPLQALFETDKGDTKLLASTALALRLLGRGEVVGAIAASLHDRSNTPEGAPLARLLGTLGDARALTALCDVAKDANASLSVRGAACEAIGELCDLRPRPWTSALSTDLHYALLPSTLLSFSAAGDGILEMR
jgi:HEAT repeat protein